LRAAVDVEHRQDLRRDQPAADADRDDAADPDGARRGVRVPLRHVQHRRPGPVLRRADLLALGRPPLRRHVAAAARVPGDARRRRRGRRLGRDRRRAEGGGRRPRGDLDDHAELDRVLRRPVPVRARRPAAGLRALGAEVEPDRALGPAARDLGQPAAAPRRHLHRPLRAGGLLVHPQPDHPRLRGQGGRVQPRGGPLRRHLGLAQVRDRPGDLGRVRRPGGLDGHPRLGVLDRDERHPGEPDRVHRHRRRPARARPPDRDRAGGAALRRPRGGHVHPRARPDRVPARAGGQPGHDHPGPHRPLRRRRAAAGLRLAGAAVAAEAPGATARHQPAGGGAVSAMAATLRARVPTGARAIGLIGVGFGFLAMWLALPPFEVRAQGAPVALAVIGLGCGAWALQGREWRIGGWAVGVSIVAVLIAVWAQGRSTDTLAAIVNAGLLASTLQYATPLGWAAIGGVISERSGVVNIGLEGMMLTGAFFGIWAAAWSGTWTVGLLVAIVAGGALAAVHAIFTIHLRADQIVIGTAINFLALGITGYM